MAIKALFTEGATSITLAPLFQWDYGQELEIEAAGLPSLIEVHFACHGMTEAVVHTCSCVGGIATVSIPDRCLEQAGDITAWVYEVNGSAGRTIYSIKIPVTTRTRPARSESIPQTVQDTYTQLITEVNQLLGALQNGTVNVGYAQRAGVADKATTADSATTATNANTAGGASYAVTAAKDSAGNTIVDTYMKIPKDYTLLKVGDTLPLGLYHFTIMNVAGTFDNGHSFITDLGCKGNYPAHVYSPLMANAGGAFERVAFTFNGLPSNPGYTYTSVQRSAVVLLTDTDTTDFYGLQFNDITNDNIFAIYYTKLSN